MESPSTVKTPPTETFTPEGQEEIEVKCVEYPKEAYEGAVIQCGKIAPGRTCYSGSN